jgi:riboflavin kinase/FMN adenylyltransferase
MIVLRDFDKSYFRKDSVVTVGTFDGVHLGHRQIFKTLNDIAKSGNLRKVAVTFEPHPRIILSGDKPKVKILTTSGEKLRYFEELGIDVVYIIEFTKKFAETSAVDFYKDYLLDRIGMSHLVVGYDHSFGKNREGSFDTIKALSAEYGFAFSKVDEYSVGNEIASSSLIRKYLNTGQLDSASKLLGNNYSLDGKVISGDKRGQTIGFPTANILIENSHKLIPAVGVYAVKVLIDYESYYGMMNIGYRPTVKEQGELLLETHIFDFDKDIYGKDIRVEFLSFIREEKKFNSVEELKSRLQKDKENIQQNLNHFINK